MEKKALIGLVLSLIVVVLLGVALVGTWYSMESESAGVSMTMDYKLREGTVTVAGESDTDEYDEDFYETDTGAVYSNTFYIAIVALVLGIIGLITAVMAGIGKLSAKIVTIFLLLTMIFAVVAPVYFAVALPGAMDEDWSGGWDKGFWDSGEETSVEPITGTEYTSTYTIGPGYGWYLAIVAFVFALIGLIITVIPGKKAVPAPVAPSL